MNINTTSKSWVDLVVYDKKENKLLTQLNKCKTRKCSKLSKERRKEGKIFYSGQEKKCTQKSIKAFAKCAVGLYKKSNYKRLHDKFVKCGDKMCRKEHKSLKAHRAKLEK